MARTGTVFRVYSLGATLAVRRFVAMYKQHVLMLGLFVFMVLFSLSFLVRFGMAASEATANPTLTDTITPGSLALVAFVLLFVKGLSDVHRTIVKDRALWSTMVAPVREGTLRTGLMLRTAVFQMGLLAIVMGTFVLVLLFSPEKPVLPRETGPLIVLAGLAASVLPLPFLLSAIGWEHRSNKLVLGVLVAGELAFVLMLQMMVPLWQMIVAAGGLVVICLVVTASGPPVLATAWASVEGVRFRSSRASRRMPPLFAWMLPRKDIVARALFRREMILSYPGKQRVAIAGLNVAMAVGLVIVSIQLGELMRLQGYGDDFYNLITPVMVGLGIYMICFFQATMPLVDGVSKEGPAFWAVRVAPVEPWRYLAAKVRPLLAFLPLTMVATGFAIPFALGRGWEAMVIGMLGAAAVYFAFLGVGAWAGATYPNLDKHSNAPPDVVLAFYLMFACLILQALMLSPVLAFSLVSPTFGVLFAAFALAFGFIIMWVGIMAGGRSIKKLEVG
ncbi:MAG: hypothetical protein JSW25_02205 [Thermoplasmata archaeon]|nr:MAG: hypothetical protein JSW25_02205 [Thermoplasmata archaeon]